MTRERKTFFILFFLLLGIFSLGVGINFTPLKFPNDGASYVAQADAIVQFGKLQTAASLPRGKVFGYQNGIIYILASLKWLLGSFWPAGYVMMISLLWTFALIEIHRLSYEILEDRFASYLVTGATFLSYEMLLSATSFINESIYLPIFFIVTCYYLRKKEEPLPEMNVLGIAFLLLGLILRYIHINLLFALIIYTFFFEKKFFKRALLITVGSVGVFGLYVLFVGKTTEGSIILDVLRGLSSFQLSSQAESGWSYFNNDILGRLVFMAQAFVLYLNPEKIFGSRNPVIFIPGLIALPVVLYGLFSLKEKLGKRVYFLIIYFASMLGFLFLMPVRVDRYALTLYFYILLAIAFALTKWNIKHLIRPALVLLGVTSLCLTGFMTTRYLLGGKHPDPRKNPSTYRFLAVLKDFKENYNPASFLIYSTEGYMSYWVFKQPVCERVTPPECGSLKFGDSLDHPIIFFGTQESFENIPLLSHDYVISSSYVEPRGPLGAWKLTKRDKKNRS